LPERYLGRTLGRFRVEGLSGSGGFAWVYKAYDPDLEVPVALKILKPQYAGDEKFESRFRREAATAARLRHPNIIKIFAVGKEGDAVYFAMDYLPNGLPDRLEALGTLPEPVLVRLGIDVASAIGFAHREGVIHRDIKVDNILFDDHGNAIVADFGIARAVSNYVQQTGTNMVVGTPQYFSPEQARGMPLDGRADIYSLGVTLYKAATGTLPFEGTDWYEIARQHVEEKPPRPRGRNPHLSKGIERVILKCLEKDPADRYQTGEALAQDLANLLHDQANAGTPGTPRHSIAVLRGAMPMPGPTSDAPTAPVMPPWIRAKRRRRRLMQWTAAVLVLAALGYGGYTFRNLTALIGRRPPPTQGQPAGPATTPAEGPPVTSAPRRTAADSAAGRPSAPVPPPPVVRPLFRVDAPADARITVNGAEVPYDWHSDTLAPGRYDVTGVVPGKNGCPPSHQIDSVTMADHGTTIAKFIALGCGTVALDVQPQGAAYAIRSFFTGDEVMSGRTPITEPIMLPDGAYSVDVSARDCATYRDTLHVDGDSAETRRLRVRLVCGT
jgi:eukaryotic-like serine/threonine-protein kinase